MHYAFFILHSRFQRVKLQFEFIVLHFRENDNHEDVKFSVRSSYFGETGI